MTDKVNISVLSGASNLWKWECTPDFLMIYTGLPQTTIELGEQLSVVHAVLAQPSPVEPRVTSIPQWLAGELEKYLSEGGEGNENVDLREIRRSSSEQYATSITKSRMRNWTAKVQRPS